MKKLLPVLLLLCVLLPSCGRRARIIPEDTLSDIFVDMLLADQWLELHPGARRTADTTLFYEPVFRNYGYSFKDFDASINHYLLEASDLEKILKKSEEKIKKEKDRLDKIFQASEKAKAFNDSIRGYESSDFDKIRLKLSLFNRDTLKMADSLSVCDSLAQKDTVSFIDSVQIENRFINVKGRNGFRADSLKKARKFSRIKSAAIDRKTMQL